jgi:hypothetical protein
MASHYGDEDSVRVFLKSFDSDDQLTPELLEEIMTAGDDFILDDIDEKSLPSTTPRQIVRAASYWAIKEGLDIFYNGEAERSQVAIHYQKEAEKKKLKYLAENPTMTEEKKYSCSHTPSGDQFRRSDSGYVDPRDW